MRGRLTTLLLTAALAACASGDEPGVVARAGEHTMTVERLAETLAAGDIVPLRRDMVEMWAQRWVEFSLFTQAVAAGDSMLDEETVLYARWPDTYQILIEALRQHLVAERVVVDETVLDSAYRDAERRMLYHILIRMPPDVSAVDRRAARGRAERVRARLIAGEPWETLNELNEDPGARAQGGGLGLVARDQTVPPFAEAAFALAPGGFSDIVETQFGYHVIWRPALDEVRDRFADLVRLELEGRVLTTYEDALVEEREVEVRPEAPALMREAARAPFTAYQDPKPLGFRDGARFSTLDFVHWLQALPPYVHQQVAGMADEQLEYFVTDLMLQEIQVEEARRVGLTVPDTVVREMRDLLEGDVRRVRERLQLDSALATAATAGQRSAAAQAVVDAYFLDIATRMQGAVVVPAFLADRLRQEYRWRMSARGLDETLVLAQALRERRTAASDSTTEPPQPEEGR